MFEKLGTARAVEVFGLRWEPLTGVDDFWFLVNGRGRVVGTVSTGILGNTLWTVEVEEKKKGMYWTCEEAKRAAERFACETENLAIDSGT